MTNYTPTQLEAWAGLGRLNWWSDGEITDLHGKSIGLISSEGAEYITVIAASPDLARLVLERDAEIARLKGLAWIAYHEFNAINARSGGPLDQYGMVTVTHEYWQAITDLFAKAAGETTPWPTENAKAIFEEINRQAVKETSDE